MGSRGASSLTAESPTSVPADDPSAGARGHRVYSIFLSSPGDVEDERDAATRAVNRINADMHDVRLQLVRWEDAYYTASASFQPQIEKPSECDLVVCIFWKRLGTDLPDQYRRADGSLPTGTEFEFEQAVQHAADSPEKIPDVLVYRKTAEVVFTERNLELEKAQRDRFLSFWRRWFHNEKGQFVAGFHSFASTPEFEAMIEAHIRKWLRDRTGDVTWTQGNPFRGLRPFDVEHAPIFFGRRRESERARARFLTNALSGVRFLLIVGPSGSGKSSLVRAGLIPRLMPAGGLGGLPRLSRRAIVSPAALVEGEPVDWTLGLARALFTDAALGRELAHGDFNTAEQLAALLARGGQEAAAPVRRALERAATDPGEHGAVGLILVVDQLEEILAWPDATAETFAACLAALTAFAPIYVIATMRSEFQHRLDDVPSLAKLAAVRNVHGPDELERILDIGVPGPGDIRDMIAGPARAAGLGFEKAVQGEADLQTRIERGASPETLPALQYLLTELYEERNGNMLTHAAYDSLGGVAGVLRSRGDTALGNLDDAGEAAFRNLVRSLVRTGSGETPAVARRIRTNLFAADSREGKLAGALRDAGLLVSDRDTLRLAHESLITGWEKLGTVVAKERRLFDIRERLLLDYPRYMEARATDPATARKLLLRGLTLEEARELLAEWGRDLLADPYPGLPDFIAESDRAHRLRWTLQLVAGSAASVVLAALILGGLWFWSESVQSARSAKVRLELARAEAALRAQDWDRALDVATRAYDLDDTPETRSTALTALLEHSSPNLAQRLPGPAIAARFAADGTLMTLSPTGSLLFLTGVARRQVKLAEPDAPGTSYLDFAPLPNGSVVVLMSDGRTGWLDAQNLQPTAQAAQPAWITAAGYVLSPVSPTDIVVTDKLVRVAVADGGLKPGRLLTCNVAGVRDCRVTDLPPELRALAIAPNGGQLAIATDAGVKVLDPDAPATASASAYLDFKDDAVRSLGWAAAGAILTVGTKQGELQALVRKDGGLDRRSQKKLSTRPVVVQKGAPGRQAAAACDEDQICLVEFDAAVSLQERARLYHTPASVLRLAWSEDGRRLVSVHADGGQVRVWDSTPQKATLDGFASVGATLTSLAVDRPTGRIAAGDPQGRIWIWSGRDDTKGRRLDVAADEVVHLAFSPAGVLAAAFKNGTLARIPKEPDAAIARIDTGTDIRRIGWLPDGTTLAATGPTEIIMVDAAGHLARSKLAALKVNQTIGGLLRAPGGAGAIISISDGTLLRWEPGPGTAAQPLVPPKDSVDTLSAGSLSLHPSGRWLTTTRADDQLRVYDLTGRAPPFVLPLPTRDSQVVAFSPDGKLLAALTSDDQVHIWRFDAQAGRAELLVSVPPVPIARWASADQSHARQALWIDWIDDSHLGVASRAGAVLILSAEQQDWAGRLNALRVSQ
jgi:WD40 repeat protein